MATVIEHPTYFTSLPREYYFSSEIYERELERIFRRQWMYFGHANQISQPGDFLVRDLVGESIVVIRAADGAVHAFVNICRHRGSRLCETGAGHARRARIVCPYHQWSYEADGRLVNAPTMPDGEGFDYADWGLHRLQAEVWHGLVFICLSREPVEPLASHFAPFEQDVLPAQPERLKEANAIVYETEANWKIVFENFMECYHCPGAHPELCRVMHVPTQFVDGILDEPLNYDGGEGLPLQPPAQTISIDGTFTSKKLLGDFAENGPPDKPFNKMLFVQPAMSILNFFADHVIVAEIRPVAIDRSHTIIRWLVHEDAVEGVDYDLDQLCYVLDVTNRQDKPLMTRVQAGIQSRWYEPGPLSAAREGGMRASLITYLNAMEQA